jgi:hypothetical protein
MKFKWYGTNLVAEQICREIRMVRNVAIALLAFQAIAGTILIIIL